MSAPPEAPTVHAEGRSLLLMLVLPSIAISALLARQGIQTTLSRLRVTRDGHRRLHQVQELKIDWSVSNCAEEWRGWQALIISLSIPNRIHWVLGAALWNLHH